MDKATFPVTIVIEGIDDYITNTITDAIDDKTQSEERIAREIDCREIADHISVYDIAQEINHKDIAEEVDYELIADYLAKNSRFKEEIRNAVRNYGDENDLAARVENLECLMIKLFNVLDDFKEKR